MTNEPFVGLLGDALSNPLLNVGIGLLAAGGPSLAPTSTGQALAAGFNQANRAQQLQLQNQLVRDRISTNARKRQAQDQLREQLPEHLGLLADVAPEQLAQGLLAQTFPNAERSAPPAVRMLEAMGIDPASAQGQELLMSKFQGDPTAGVIKQLQVAGLIADQAERTAQLEDAAISAHTGIQSLDTIAGIPGAELLLTQPQLIPAARLALNDPTGLLQQVPEALAGIPQEQFKTALNAVETVEKQRNALGQGLGQTGAGAAGLLSQLQALGQGAGLAVQRDVFAQALERLKRTAEGSNMPLNLKPTAPAAVAGRTQRPPTAREIATRRPKARAPARDTPPVPQSLIGRTLQWNAAMQMYRDKGSGEFFNANGEPVAP